MRATVEVVVHICDHMYMHTHTHTNQVEAHGKLREVWNHLELQEVGRLLP